MLVYFVRRGHAEETIGVYLREWAPDLRDRIRIVPYEELDRLEDVHAATYLFTDLERLSESERAAAATLADELAAHERVRVLNHPRRVKGRYELLRELSERGLNDFRARRLAELDDTVRYPVFLRRASEHEGPATALLRNREQCERAVAELLLLGHPLDDLLAVEFLDTSDDQGVVRKYGEFVVDGELVPRHIFFDRAWSVKEPRLADPELLAEQRRFLQTDPHRDRLEELARIAGVDYGRLDYAFCSGRLQLWEVNTNPVVLFAHSHYAEAHLPEQEQIRALLEPHFARLCGSADAPAIASLGKTFEPMAVPRRRVAWRVAGRLVPRRVRPALARLLARTPPVRRLVRRRLTAS